ncbi:MAG: TonB family protein [Bacteroidota bacterium]
MTWWHYLLLANVYLTLFFVFYALFLRRETFFNLNRVYLVSSAILSFLIPIIQSSWIKNLFITQRVKETIYHVGPAVMNSFTVTANAATPGHQLTMGQILLAIYVSGILILSVKFIYQLAVINYVISQPKSDTSYSFFNRIRIEERDTDNDAITAHEQVHARQWHSVDVLLLETIMIINWFNPVVYLYRNAVKYIHEFIADRDALKAGLNKADYAMLLLSQTFITPPYHLVNPFFNSSLLKQRIQMLHKNKSHRAMLIKYGLSAPLFALMLVLSSATVNNSKTLQAINTTAQEVFITPAAQTFSTGTITAADQADLDEVIKQHEQASAQAALAQANIPGGKLDNAIFTGIEHSAEFPGGIEGFSDFLSGNIRYPVEARKKNIQGKVYCTFIVEKDGSISGLKVVRGIGGGADEEALRVLSAMPKWEPGTQNGNKVRQLYTVPINFALSEKPIIDAGEVYTSVEQSAVFPGGVDAFTRYLGKTIRYPQEAREKKVQGKVLVTFVVEKDGSLSDVRIVHDIGGGLGDEALRVVKQSPKWLPAMQNGVLIRQQYTTPISFSLTDDIVAEPARKDNTGIPSNAYNISPINNDRVADTSSMEARFVSHVKNQASTPADNKVANNAVRAGIKPLNILKDKAVKNMYGDKAANGIVLMITKGKPFFKQESLLTDQ